MWSLTDDIEVSREAHHRRIIIVVKAHDGCIGVEATSGDLRELS